MKFKENNNNNRYRYIVRKGFCINKVGVFYNVQKHVRADNRKSVRFPKFLTIKNKNR